MLRKIREIFSLLFKFRLIDSCKLVREAAAVEAACLLGSEYVSRSLLDIFFSSC